ncbi:hypothetical protein C0Q70_16453 [Pomacea canaliculata]|uniref:EGF-like domain-containing protein n=1 Tax=Pomacea canaliculata TaxID=400727 RepID=A0A2T7NPU2_POMCA|nr:post-GPI attachment to proteins factor 6-like [Pomacea canaliculata]PVD23190.1 hypothetical protein C0Q70_16453 [Pomacea canaliculata]
MRGHYRCIPIWLLFIIDIKENVQGLVWKSEEPVTYYSGYVSVTMHRYTIPEDTSSATWSFRAFKSNSVCDDKGIDVYLQFGSLPAVSPMNATFPGDFYLNRTNLVQLSLKSDNVSIHHTELFPLSGNWFAIALIPEKNDKIQQKGLTTACIYYVMSSLEVKAVPDYVLLAANHPVIVSLNSLPPGSDGGGVWVRFTLPQSSFAISLEVKNCNVTPCHLQLSYQDHKGQLMQQNCTNVDKTACLVNLTNPLHDFQYFVHLALVDAATRATVVTGLSSQGCSSPDVTQRVSEEQCYLHPLLDRYQGDADYSTRYVQIVNNRVEETYRVLYNRTTLLPFMIEDHVDIGGTLIVQILFDHKNMAETQSHIRVCGIVERSYFHLLTSDMNSCPKGANALQINTDIVEEVELESSKIYVPYPEEGRWFLALRMYCFTTFSNHSGPTPAQLGACSRDSINVTVKVSIQGCVDGSCNGRGTCKVYVTGSDFIIFSTCRCVGGWDGYGCTDGTNAASDADQLLELLLLTLSNLFFIPAIGLSLKRHYYLEAIVYFYNMFFSTFYHACDGNRIAKYIYCLTEYSVLANCDFLGSACSLWVTLIAMAQLRVKISLTLQMLGPLALIVGVLLDRTSVYLIAVPAVSGILIVLAVWGRQCYLERKCFPTKRRYLCMLPGALIAITGAVLFAFFETGANYKYIHSAWHIALSMSIIFLLPPPLRAKGSPTSSSNDTESEEALVLGRQPYNQRINFEL